MNVLTLKNITLRPQGRALLEDVTLSVATGELVALRGLSPTGGAGILNIAAGVLAPDAGTAELLGTAVYALGEQERAALRGRAVGYVGREPAFWTRMTVLENVCLPLRLRGEDGADRGAALLETLGLAHIQYAFPGSLSQREKLAAALARAVIGGPELLLLDNIFEDMDEGNAAYLAEQIVRLQREKGFAVLLCASDTCPLRADRTIHFQYGRITG